MDPINIQLSTISPRKSKKANFRSILVTLLTTTMGVTTLFMPKLLLETGVGLGMGVLLTSCFLSYFTCSFLCEAARRLKVNSYPLLTQKLLGKMAFIVDIFYVLYLFGIIVSNQTFVCKSMTGSLQKIFLPGVEKNSKTYLNLSVAVIFMTNLAILPFVVSRNLNNLKALSKFTIIGFTLALLTIIGTYMMPSFFGFSIDPLNIEKLSLARWNGLKTTYGMYLLSTANHLVIIDINAELRPKRRSLSKRLLFANNLFCFIIYGLISIYGFLALYQNPRLEKLNSYFLFFLEHKNLDQYFLRTAHFLLIVSIMFSNIFMYVPLIKYFNSMVVSEMHEKISIQSVNEVG